jgi:ABC-type sugar transport system permease subunit
MRPGQRRRDIRTAYLLLSPAVLLLLTVLAYPLGWEIWTSFTSLSPLQDGGTAFVGLENYRRQLSDAQFFGTGAWAFLSVTLFNIWRGSSFIGVLLLAGINAVPPELFEYALLESKSPWQRFRMVTLPLLKPFLALAVFLSLTSVFVDLANVWMLTAGRIVFPVIGTEAYWLAIKAGQFGPASALSLMLVPFLLGSLLVLFRLFDSPDGEPA